MKEKNVYQHKKQTRCQWAQKEIFHTYHDTQWCVENHNDTYMFEMLVLEGAQAGLSWETILKKRKAYQNAFCGFDVSRVAQFKKSDVDRLCNDSGIVRNRLKIQSAISNANAYMQIQKEYGSFDAYIWQFSDFVPVVNKRKRKEDIPPRTPLSDTVSKDLKKRGFSFVGSVIVYSFLQAIGVVNDHQTCCFKGKE